MSRRKIWVFIITIVVLISASLQVYAASADYQRTRLELSINTATENNSSLKLIDDKIKLAERKYNTALIVSKEAPDKFWDNDTKLISNKKEEILYPMQRQAELDELKWQRQNNEKNLKLDVIKIYHKILAKQKQIETQQSAIERADNEYSIKKKQVELGTLASSAFITYEIAVDEAKTRMATIERDRDKLIMDLNQKMGLDIDQELVLKEEKLPDTYLEVIDIDELVEKVMMSSHSIKKLETDKLLADKERWILVTYSSLYIPKEADKLEEKMLNLDYSIRDEKVAVEYKLRSDYNNLFNLKDDITLKEMDYDKAVKLHDVAKVRYEFGLINNLELQKTQGDVDDAWLAYNQAKLDLYLGVENFKSYIYPLTLEGQ